MGNWASASNYYRGTPIRKSVRQIASSLQEVVDTEELGIVWWNHTPWSYPTVMKDALGDSVDLKKLSAVAHQDTYPLYVYTGHTRRDLLSL